MYQRNKPQNFQNNIGKLLEWTPKLLCPTSQASSERSTFKGVDASAKVLTRVCLPNFAEIFLFCLRASHDQTQNPPCVSGSIPYLTCWACIFNIYFYATQIIHNQTCPHNIPETHKQRKHKRAVSLNFQRS